jgi:hypothetical protein
MGTVGYMAPERFGPGAADALTPASDVFSWGAVVAYAGTGRVPFGVDTAPIVALRIMTQPPDLEGLTGPLRDLVEQALAKDPADRPTARELLDRLLAVGPARPMDLDATAVVPAPRVPSPDQTADVPPATKTGPTALVLPARRRGVGHRVALATATVLALGLLLGAGAASGIIPLPGRHPVGASGTDTSQSPTASPAGAPPPGAPVTAQLVVRDPLIEEAAWSPTQADGAACAFEDQSLVVTRVKPGVFKCPGLEDYFTDFAAYVDVTLGEPGNCAAIWFRFTGSEGYALRVCEDGFAFVTHHPNSKGGVRPRQTIDLTIPRSTPVRVGIVAEGNTFRFFRDGEQVGRPSVMSLFREGRLALGILQRSGADPPPFRVSFANLEIWQPGA